MDPIERQLEFVEISIDMNAQETARVRVELGELNDTMKDIKHILQKIADQKEGE